jgi:hypothetical protein
LGNVIVFLMQDKAQQPEKGDHFVQNIYAPAAPSGPGSMSRTEIWTRF